MNPTESTNPPMWGAALKWFRFRPAAASHVGEPVQRLREVRHRLQLASGKLTAAEDELGDRHDSAFAQIQQFMAGDWNWHTAQEALVFS